MYLTRLLKLDHFVIQVASGAWILKRHYLHVVSAIKGDSLNDYPSWKGRQLVNLVESNGYGVNSQLQLQLLCTAINSQIDSSNNIDKDASLPQISF